MVKKSVENERNVSTQVITIHFCRWQEIRRLGCVIGSECQDKDALRLPNGRWF
jgi:hypothetical protein